MKRVIFVEIALITALAAGIAFAWGPGFGRGFGFGPPFANLSSEQSSKVQALRDAFLKKVEPLRDDFLAKRGELQKLWSTPGADPAIIVAKQKEMVELQATLQDAANQFRAELQKVLPESQSFGRRPGFGPRGFGPGGPGMGFGPGGPGVGFGPGAPPFAR